MDVVPPCMLRARQRLDADLSSVSEPEERRLTVDPGNAWRLKRMLPIDINDERDRRRRKALRALAVDVRHARLHATPAEVVGLTVLVEDCQAQTIEPEEARVHVLRLRAMQDQRAA